MKDRKNQPRFEKVSAISMSFHSFSPHLIGEKMRLIHTISDLLNCVLFLDVLFQFCFFFLGGWQLVQEDRHKLTIALFYFCSPYFCRKRINCPVNQVWLINHPPLTYPPRNKALSNPYF